MSGSLKDLDYLVSKLRKIVPVNLQEILDSKSEIGHNHNTIYYLKSEIDNLIAGSGFSGSYADLANVPTTFTPSVHNHNDLYYTETEIILLLAAKANSVHTHPQSDITNLVSDLANISSDSIVNALIFG